MNDAFDTIIVGAGGAADAGRPAAMQGARP
jgi:hypothetical protein